MRRRILTGIIIFILISAGIAYSDFGSFSGNSDYSSSSSSSSSSSGSSWGDSSSGSYSDSYSTRTRTRRTAPEYNMGGNVNFIPTAGVRSPSNYDDDDDFSEIGGVVFVLAVFFIFWLIISRNSKITAIRTMAMSAST